MLEDEDDDDAEPELESPPHAAMSVESAAAPPAPPMIFRNFLREESSRTSSSSAPSRDTSGPASVVVTGRTSRSVGNLAPLCGRPTVRDQSAALSRSPQRPTDPADR